MTYNYVNNFKKNYLGIYSDRFNNNSKDQNHLLFSFSQGQGTGLYFLYLCWVAQPVVNTKIKNITIRRLISFELCFLRKLIVTNDFLDAC
jgi:hypothetical protein